MQCSFRLLSAALLITLATHGTAVVAQSWPTRPVKLVMPWTPGSAVDVVGRAVGERLAAEYGQPFVVENRPGAGGTIGTGLVARAAPDGYTLGVVSSGTIVTSVVYDNLSFDPTRDLAGVAPLANLPSVLVVSGSTGLRSVAELVSLARGKPGELNYASGGVGSASHVNAEKFLDATGLKVLHVPLKGAPEMITEMLAGRVQFGFLPIVAALPAMKDGRLAGLAVSAVRRAGTLPGVPTVVEAGVPEAVFNFWVGMLAPVATPRPIVTRLSSDIARVLDAPDLRDRLARLGADPMPMGPEQFDAFIRSEFASLAPLMRRISAPR